MEACLIQTNSEPDCSKWRKW